MWPPYCATSPRRRNCRWRGREGGREAEGEGENEVKKEGEGRGRNTLISNSQLQFLFELAVILLQ